MDFAMNSYSVFGKLVHFFEIQFLPLYNEKAGEDNL